MKRLNFLVLLVSLSISCSERPPEKKKHQEEKKDSNIFYDKAYEFNISHQFDSAYIYFDKARYVFRQQKDSLGIGKCLLGMAILSSKKTDYFGSQELSLSAIEYFDKKNAKHHIFIKSNLNNLGLASQNLGRYQEALGFFQQSLAYPSDNAATRTVKNNIANIYRRLENFDRSIAFYNEILREDIPPLEFAQILSNRAYTMWLKNSAYNAEPDLLKALAIREKANDLSALTASYAHLAEYYANKEPQVALVYAQKMNMVALKMNDHYDQLQALQKLIILSPPLASKQFFKRFCELDERVQKSRDAAKNQFAVIRYETERQKADNLILQQENSARKYEITKQRFFILGVVFLALAAAFFGILLYKKRKQRIALEAQNKIRENRLKTSKKVHDVVANGLYRTMTQIENQHTIDRESILDSLEEMYEKSRDISYEVEEPLVTDADFEKRIAVVLESFNSTNTRVIVEGNSKGFWGKINEKARYEIEHVLQELMINMKKHSGANLVTIRFDLSNYEVNIYYADNGVSDQKEIQFKNGLSNTENRMASINGTITFDTNAEGGWSIRISLPIS